jgi:lysophospholipase L1-like esterase
VPPDAVPPTAAAATPVAQTAAEPTAPIPAAPAARFAFRAGDRVCLLGNALAERMQHDCWLETRLQARFPELGLSFRNLGFAGDELTVQQRTEGFGTWDDWLARCEADVVFAFFGFNESFGGPQRLDAFRADLRDFVRQVLARRDAGAAPRLVLFTPVAYELSRHAGLPDAAAQDARIRPYARAMLEVAREEGVPCIDLYDASLALYGQNDDLPGGPLTRDGIQPTSAGNELLALVIDRALNDDPDAPLHPLDAPHLLGLRSAVLEKNRVWCDCYRATDGYNVYGGRSSLAYVDGQTNLEVLQREQDIVV